MPIRQEEYAKIATYLTLQNADQVTLTIRELAKIVGHDDLPNSAKQYPEFWIYSAGTETHRYAKTWQDLGWRARLERGSQTVTFVKNSIVD